MKNGTLKAHHRALMAAIAAAITGILLLIAAKLTALEVASGSSGSIGAGASSTEIMALVLLAISLVLFGIAWHLAGKQAGA